MSSPRQVYRVSATSGLYVVVLAQTATEALEEAVLLAEETGVSMEGSLTVEVGPQHDTVGVYFCGPNAIDKLREQAERRDESTMTPPSERVPMQPLVVVGGILRFRQNALVRYLLDTSPLGLNHLAILPNIPQEDRAQFEQLIGRSLGAYADCNYALGVDEAYKAAEAQGLYTPEAT